MVCKALLKALNGGIFWEKACGTQSTSSAGKEVGAAPHISFLVAFITFFPIACLSWVWSLKPGPTAPPDPIFLKPGSYYESRFRGGLGKAGRCPFQVHSLAQPVLAHGQSWPGAVMIRATSSPGSQSTGGQGCGV
uniref:Uncharacterized protein n=1 Tax=Meleagris gallopavo TaxID=9103 RepID=A0A803YD11_MELGA